MDVVHNWLHDKQDNSQNLEENTAVHQNIVVKAPDGQDDANKNIDTPFPQTFATEETRKKLHSAKKILLKDGIYHITLKGDKPNG